MRGRRNRRPAGAEDRLVRLAEDVRTIDAGRRGGAERRLVVLGGVLAPLGLLVILLGWYGASRTSNVYEQIPYLISGGLFGLALVFLGAFLYFASWLTRMVHEQRTRSAAVVDAVDRLAAALDRQASAAPATAGDGDGGRRAAIPVDGNGDLVVTGTGTLVHRPDCRVVVGRAGVRAVTAGDGLPPCRLCNPYR